MELYNKHEGLFISLEGIDGSGKTTQAKLLVDKLSKLGYDVLYVREPGGTQIGDEIRSILLANRGHLDVPCRETEFLLFMAARMQLVNNVIKPALAANRIVICDRFMDSTIAMQGYARYNELQVLSMISLCLGLFKPHKTFFFNMSVDHQEISLSGRKLDRFENEGLEYHKRVVEGFEFCISRDPDRFKIIDVLDGGEFRREYDINEELVNHTTSLIKNIS